MFQDPKDSILLKEYNNLNLIKYVKKNKITQFCSVEKKHTKDFKMMNLHAA